MGIFSRKAITEASKRPSSMVGASPTSAAQKPSLTPPPENGSAPPVARSEIYSVRVRPGFKGEVLALQAQLQLERQRSGGKARRVTEKEIMELMLDAYKVARRNGDLAGHAVPIANDVWYALGLIARQQQVPAGEILEQLIIAKVAELGLAQQK